MKKIIDQMNNPLFLETLPKSRAEAKQLGVKYYISGKICPKKHKSYRHTVNGACAQCQSDKTIQYLNEHGATDRTRRDYNWNHSEKGKNAKQKWREKDPKWAWVVSTVGGARQRAKQKGIQFNIDNEYIQEMLPEVCPVLGIKLKYDNKRGYRPDSPSIDRIVPELGYVKGNVAIISFRANMIKSDAGVEELQKVLKWMQTQTGNSL